MIPACRRVTDNPVGCCVCSDLMTMQCDTEPPTSEPVPLGVGKPTAGWRGRVLRFSPPRNIPVLLDLPSWHKSRLEGLCKNQSQHLCTRPYQHSLARSQVLDQVDAHAISHAALLNSGNNGRGECYDSCLLSRLLFPSALMVNRIARFVGVSKRMKRFDCRCRCCCHCRSLSLVARRYRDAPYLRIRPQYQSINT